MVSKACHTSRCSFTSKWGTQRLLLESVSQVHFKAWRSSIYRLALVDTPFLLHWNGPNNDTKKSEGPQTHTGIWRCVHRNTSFCLLQDLARLPIDSNNSFEIKTLVYKVFILDKCVENRVKFRLETYLWWSYKWWGKITWGFPKT